jgi:arylsulfatase A-like enzyme
MACNSEKKGTADTKRPNILFALADDVSYPYMGAYGTSWINTPAFDRVAREGILFANAYVPNSKCSPSRASILTGRNSWQLEAGANHIVNWPKKFKTFTDALTQNGYHVGYTGRGYNPWVDGKQQSISGPKYNDIIKSTVPTTSISEIDYAANFNAFLEEKQDGVPFFFWYTSSEPHRRYEFRSGARLSQKQPSDIDRVPAFWPDNDTIRHDLLDFAYEIEYFDHQLILMLEKLDEIGELDNTMVIVTADNGMPFPRSKGQAYEISSHMPLAIMWGNGITNTSRVIEDYVSFIDFAPTILEVAKINQAETGMQPITGKSLVGILESSSERFTGKGRDFVLLGKERHDVGRPNDTGYPIRGIVKDGFLYLHNFEPDRWPSGNPETGYPNVDASPTKTIILQANREGAGTTYWQYCFGKRPQEELFNLSNDPDNVTNLADVPEYAELKEAMKNALFSALKEEGDPRMSGEGEIFEKYDYARANSRNFYPRFLEKDSTLLWAWIDSTDVEWNKLDSVRKSIKSIHPLEQGI